MKSYDFGSSLLRYVRNPKMSIFLSFLILFISCDKYEIIEDKLQFDYRMYNELKDFDFNSINIESIESFRTSSPEDAYQLILDSINEELGTTYTLPELMDGLTEYDDEYVYEHGMIEGLLTEKDSLIIREFAVELDASTFQMAIDRYEEMVVNDGSMTAEEFEKHNNVANTLKLLNELNPEKFEVQNKGLIKCIVAWVAVIAALWSFWFCATIVGCGLALTLFINAIDNMNDACEEYT